MRSHSRGGTALCARDMETYDPYYIEPFRPRAELPRCSDVLCTGPGVLPFRPTLMEPECTLMGGTALRDASGRVSTTIFRLSEVRRAGGTSLPLLAPLSVGAHELSEYARAL